MTTAVTKLNFKKADLKTMKSLFKEKKWFESIPASNSEEMLEEVLRTYEEVVHKTVPVFKPRTKDKKVWFNERCRLAKEERDKKWRNLRRRRTDRTAEEYHRARNIYTEIRREEQANYEKNIVDKYESDPKLFYKYVNGKTKIKSTIQRLKIDGKVFEDERELAQILNDKFKSVFVKDSEFQGEVANQDALQRNGLDSIRIDKTDVERRLQKINVNKAMGPDQMSGWVLKHCAEELSWPICQVFRKSLEEGYVPKKWKEAQIVAIHKGGSKEVPLNYRPVSLLCILIKVLEGMIRDVWIDFLEERESLSAKQFGFRKGRSCITNLLSFYSRVVDIIDQKGGWADCVYLDLKKAFDKISHKRLIWKIENIGGIKGRLLEWMKSYLTERKMKTVIRGICSNWVGVMSGVPQGSVLGPLLFLIFINDLDTSAGNVDIIGKFADDTKMGQIMRTDNDKDILQDSLNKLVNWANDWGMIFNVSKCKIMHIGRNNPEHIYSMGGVQLASVDEEKDVGVKVHKSLKPKSHCTSSAAKARSVLGQLGKTFHYRDRNTFMRLYKTYVRPHLDYGSSVWSPWLASDIETLEKVQMKAVRMVSGLTGQTYEERLAELKLQSLEDRRIFMDMVETYKILNGHSKVDPSTWFQHLNGRETRQSNHHHNLRRTRVSSTDMRNNFFSQRVISKWNGLPPAIKDAATVGRFKFLYKQHHNLI